MHGGDVRLHRVRVHAGTAPVTSVNEKETHCSIRFLQSARCPYCARLCSRVFYRRRNAAGFLALRGTLDSFREDCDVRRARRLSAGNRRRLLASSDLAKGASRFQATARCGDVSGAARKRKSETICATRRRWRITGNGRLRLSSCRLKWIAWREHTKQPEVLRELFEALGKRSFCYRRVSS